MSENASSPDEALIEEIEMKLFLEGIYDRYGYDFRDYAPASLKRRIRRSMAQEGAHTVSALLDKVLHDSACMNRFLFTVSVTVSAMFRDPGFYLAFREKVAPLLRAHPLIRLWHAGCSTGEEAYSMAILLAEEGLLEKTRIYATDMNEEAIGRAAQGIFPMDNMKEFTANYLKAGGKRSFSEYYTAKHDSVIMKAGLRRNIVWAAHNLVTDGSFNEFHAIFCRNVMIYFNRTLQNRAHRLIYDSLAPEGALGLGRGESLKFTPCEDRYNTLDAVEKLYIKVS